ncbi:MAG: pentapeptide repeat-containing protein [Corallococcus sp.]|nr:pentapeptide repeat-containing protein [Corallococcus sp.]
MDNYTFSYCTFANCKFKETSFRNVTFNECVFENCEFVNSVFKESAMKFCEFVKCTVIGVNWRDLSTEYATVIEKLDECLLKFNNFEDITLRKLDFGQSQIVSSTFYKTNIAECNFSKCNLNDTVFTLCDMQKCDFRLSDGFNIDSLSCKLKGAKFSAAGIEGLVKCLEIKVE